jgi:hypothetical protein
MPTKPLIKLPDIEGFAPGKGAGTEGRINVPIDGGKTVYGVQIVYKDGQAAPTDILDLLDNDIIAYRNNKEQRTHTSYELDRLNSINGSQYARRQDGAGANMIQYLNIHFFEPWRKDKFDAAAGAWIVTPELGWNSFWFKLKLAAALPATAQIYARAWVGDPIKLPAGNTQLIKKVYRDQITVGGTQKDLVNLTAKDSYQTMLFKHPDGAGVITNFTLKVNGNIKVDDMDRHDMIDHLIKQGMNPAQSTAAGQFGYEWVADVDDAKESAMPVDGATIWGQLKFDAASNGNVVVMSERIGPADV